MSRKITIATMMALILALAVATAAFAQGNPTAAQPGAGQCVNFVDADGDGVCDNAGTGTGLGAQTGGNYVDADNDGVCDNLGLNTPAQDGTGSQHGRSGGQRGPRR